MDHAELIFNLSQAGQPVSPFMNYWTLEELRRYYDVHMSIHLFTTLF